MNREVKINEQVEVLDIANQPDKENDDGGDEVIVPPVEEEIEKEDEKPQEKQSFEPSPEDKEPLQQKVKPVEGETSRERALRAEVTRLRAEKRQESQKNLFHTEQKQEIQKDERLDKIKEKYTEEEIQNTEELIDYIATKKGYVKKENSYQEMADERLHNFLDNHPEYKPENDKDDIRWEMLDRILHRDYQLKGKTQKELSVILLKAHRDVCDELGETKEISDEKKQAAQRQKIQSVSHSGGTKSKSEKIIDIDPDVRKMFKGFSDDDFS